MRGQQERDGGGVVIGSVGNIGLEPGREHGYVAYGAGLYDDEPAGVEVDPGPDIAGLGHVPGGGERVIDPQNVVVLQVGAGQVGRVRRARNGVTQAGQASGGGRGVVIEEYVYHRRSLDVRLVRALRRRVLGHARMVDAGGLGGRGFIGVGRALLRQSQNAQPQNQRDCGGMPQNLSKCLITRIICHLKSPCSRLKKNAQRPRWQANAITSYILTPSNSMPVPQNSLAIFWADNGPPPLHAAGKLASCWPRPWLRALRSYRHRTVARQEDEVAEHPAHPLVLRLDIDVLPLRATIA